MKEKLKARYVLRNKHKLEIHLENGRIMHVLASKIKTEKPKKKRKKRKTSFFDILRR